MAEVDLAERYFWAFLFSAILVFTCFAYFVTSNAERERVSCVKSCGVYAYKFIGDVCHCKVNGGWRESLPEQVKDEL